MRYKIPVRISGNGYEVVDSEKSPEDFLSIIDFLDQAKLVRSEVTETDIEEYDEEDWEIE